MKKSGIFITFEGIDGCGKTTQTDLLVSALKKAGCKILLTREPGGSKVAEKIRNILLDPANKMNPLTELFLYESSRIEHVTSRIKPALEKGYVVICDRFTDATTAYQGFARGLGKPLVRSLNNAATLGIKPDLTIFIDVPVSTSLKRARALKNNDRIEKEKNAFFHKVRKGYLDISKEEPSRFKVFRGERTIDAIHSQIMRLVMGKLKSRKLI